VALRGQELSFCRLGLTVEETAMSLRNCPVQYVALVTDGSFKGSGAGSTGDVNPLAWPLFCRHPEQPAPLRIAERDELFHRHLLAMQEESPALLGSNVEVERAHSI
jgi:hypothetical protein